MNLNELITNIDKLLENYDYYKLPNRPNVGGKVQQTTVLYAIESGVINKENNRWVDVKIKFLLSAMFNQQLETNKDINLNQLIQEFIHHMNMKRVSPVGLLRFQNFDIFTPEHGTWKTMIEFNTTIELICESFLDDQRCIE